MEIFDKNREREKYTFANINLLGKCNANCYFCLGKDIDELLTLHNQIDTHFLEWENFDAFLDMCREKEITKIYITGQNVDSLQYKFLAQLIIFLKNRSFTVGLRTNGYLAEKKMDIIQLCDDEIGYSINALNPESNKAIMGRSDLPNWDYILTNTPNSRVSIVVNHYNIDEFKDIIKLAGNYPNVSYVQARRISTDTRQEELSFDIHLYEVLYQMIKREYPKLRDFYAAEIFNIYGVEVCFWRTVQTTVNSINYFTDGTLSGEYFIVEGYKKNRNTSND
jgi:molybdenum cofactor biosynthesis enzyme MoaA